MNISTGHEYYIQNTNIQNTNLYTIKLKRPNRSLLLSLVKTGILLGGTISDNYQSITFNAESVNSLVNSKTKYKNNYEISMKILYYLSNQFKYLIEKSRKIFFQLKPENIIIIDNGKKFIYISNEDLIDISDEGIIVIDKPFTKNKYDSPEIHKLTSIPSVNIHYKAIYYSLGMFILSLFLDDIYNTNETNEINEINEINKIKGTKLFYALDRCLKKEPKLRTLLFV